MYITSYRRIHHNYEVSRIPYELPWNLNFLYMKSQSKSLIYEVLSFIIYLMKTLYNYNIYYIII